MPGSIAFQALMANSPNAYVVLDAGLDIVWMNEAYLRTTMRSREELLGQPMFEAFPSDPESESHRLLEASLRRVLVTGEADEIALIRYDIRDASGAMATRYWSATHTPVCDADGRTEYVLQHTVDVTELHGLRAWRDEMGLVQRANAVQARNRDLSEESGYLKALFEQAPGFVAVLSGPDHEFRQANRAYRQLVGQREVVGKTVAEALPEVVGQGFVDLLSQVHATGQPYVGRSEKVILDSTKAGKGGERYLDFVYQPIFGEEDVVQGVLIQGHDVTERVAAQEQQALLINELNHRVKNTLAIVHGLANQSFKKADGAQDALRSFEARLHALAAAHTLLTGGHWKTAGLREAVKVAIEATAGSAAERVHVDGPDIELPPQAAMSAAMVIHELSTNAIKYGALSQGNGRIDLSWTVEDEADCRRMALEWRESGGPPASEPARRGFGTRLIQGGFATGLGGKAGLDFRPEGLLCTIDARFPVDAYDA